MTSVKRHLPTKAYRSLFSFFVEGFDYVVVPPPLSMAIALPPYSKLLVASFYTNAKIWLLYSGK
jgi:hypothetical protein